MQELHSPVTNTEHLSIVARPARKRRRWSAAEKQAILGQIGQNGMTTSSVSRKYGISLRLLFAWKRLAHQCLPDKPAQDMKRTWELYQLQPPTHGFEPSVEARS